MKKILSFCLLAVGCLLLNMGTGTWVFAQEEDYILAHEDFFGRLQRPPVPFPHELHEDALEEEGCGVCHHVYSDEKQALVPADGEETGCMDCHQAKREAHTPNLREAYHGSCNVCHRTLKKEGQAGGPTTCRGCHPKSKPHG